jgi:2-methylcitrate dehydratase PrpD
MDMSFTLADTIYRTSYDDLPVEAIEITKKDILDVLGTAIAGGNALGVNEIAGLIKEWGGKKESTVIGFGCKVPSANAALVNATMSHALDYDDGYDPAIVHTACSVVPASFAIAERTGNVNGKKFITAVALGIDLMCRMGLATRLSLRESGWVYTSIFGYFGAAASAGKILGLNNEKIVNALGIAYSQTAGNFQSIKDAVLTKRIQPGFASKAGVLSALLAERGITGIQNSIEGDYGIYNVYLRGQYDPLALTSGLGEVFEVVNVGFKPYPCCGYTHNPIFATLALTIENNIRPENVDSITISTGQNAGDLLEPLERKRQPRSVPDAQFSIPFTVATAIVKRKVSIDDFTPEAINDPAVLQIAQKVNACILPELTRRQVEPAIVEIRTKDGNVYSKRMDDRKGSPENAMSMDEISDKFRDCASHSRVKLSKRSINTMISLIKNLEDVKDVGEIIRMAG